MRRFQNLLVSLANAPADEAALDRGIRLAEHLGARLTLVGAVECLPWYSRLVMPDPEAIQAMLTQEVERSLERAAEVARSKGLEVTTRAVTGRLAPALLHEVVQGGHDLLLRGTAPDTPEGFHAIDTRLLRMCPCPVWLVRPCRGERLIERALVAVDPHPDPEVGDGLQARLLETAVTLADWEGWDLGVVHVWDAPGARLLRYNGLGAQEVEHYVDRARNGAAGALDRLLAPYAGRIPPGRVSLLRGTPCEVLPRFAEREGVDVILMGTVARTGLPALILGNTAETILQRVHCSVLAVKPDGFGAPAANGGAS